MTENDDLRQLFDDATAGIRPQGSYEEISARTGQHDPAARRWFLPTIAAAAVVAVALGGTLFLSRDRSTHQSPNVHPATNAPTSAAPPVTTKTSPVYYLGDTASGPRLFAERTELDSTDGNPSGFATQAADDAVSGKSLDPDYRSPWPAGTTVQGVGGCEGGGCQIQVTFAGNAVADRPAGMSEAVARLAIEQLVRTVQAAMGNHDPVFFTSFNESDNKTERLDQVLGVTGITDVTPGNDNDVLAPVQITSLASDDAVPPGDLKVSGIAATFEANVVWELMVGGDTVVQNGHTTAAECCTLSPYSFTLKGLEPGTYTLVVHDTDESGAGRAVDQDSKEFVVVN